MEVSKDLFIEVRGGFNKEIFELISKGNSIEINSFFFDCKAWAIFMEYDICSGYDSDIADGMYFCKIENYKLVEKFAEYDKTEIELVFEACEWILKTTPKDLLEYFNTTKVRVHEKQLQH